MKIFNTCSRAERNKKRKIHNHLVEKECAVVTVLLVEGKAKEIPKGLLRMVSGTVRSF